MNELALFGGPPAVTPWREAQSPLGEVAVGALLQTVESARRDRACLSGLSGSGAIAALERDLASYIGTPYVVAVASGTSALHAALLAVGVKPGDQVIVPAYTWSQTVAPVIHIGAVPHFVDIEPAEYGLDPLHVARAINSRTRAILVVHIYGNPADIVALRQLAEAHQIPLIEDCAQAMGALVDGRPVGRHGDAACFSIGPGKPLTGGEGGFIVTKDRRLYERCVELTQHPIRQRFDLWGGKHTDFGLGCRMHPLAAVIARAELQSLDRRTERRARFFEALGRALQSVPGVHPRTEAGRRRPANYRYCPSFAPEELDVPISRQLFVEALRSEGVPIVEDPIALPLHQRSFRPFVGPRGRRPRLPVTEARCQYTGLAFAPDLTEIASDKTIGQIREAFQKVACHAERVMASAQREAKRFPGTDLLGATSRIAVRPQTENSNG